MPQMTNPDRRFGPVLAVAVAALAIAIPVIVASPWAAPGSSAAPEKPAKPEKGAETAISLTGTVQKAVDTDGRPTYSMTVDGKTWTISAGPSWFWGDENPLAAYVGKSVTIAGTTRAGDTEVDVEAVDDEALREPGKPPWAGGPWRVGPTHPGWKAWMANGKPGHGRDGAPGQVKKETPAP